MRFSFCRDPLRLPDDPHAVQDAMKWPKAGNGAFRARWMAGRRVVPWKYSTRMFPVRSQ